MANYRLLGLLGWLMSGMGNMTHDPNTSGARGKTTLCTDAQLSILVFGRLIAANRNTFLHEKVPPSSWTLGLYSSIALTALLEKIRPVYYTNRRIRQMGKQRRGVVIYRKRCDRGGT